MSILPTGIFQSLSFYFYSEERLQKELVDAIDRNDSNKLRQIAPHLSLNKNFAEINELPVFYALWMNKPEIADILVDEFGAKVELNYPQYGHRLPVTALEKACVLSAMGEFTEEYLLKIRNYTGDKNYLKLQGEKTIKSGIECFKDSQKNDCKNVEPVCIQNYEKNIYSQQCKGWEFRYQKEETILYAFVSHNSTHYEFASAISDGTLINPNSEDSDYSVVSCYDQNNKTNLPGCNNYPQEGLE